jgi:hypothetical protein
MKSQSTPFRNDVSVLKAAGVALGSAGILTCTSLSALGTPSALPYDLPKVEGMAHFQGSEEARKLLSRNGFVVADPYFKQLFQPYIENPLPVFITTDSLGHLPCAFGRGRQTA